MSVSGSMAKRHRRSFSPEFKAQIVDLCHQPVRTVASVCQEFDLDETAVCRSVRRGEIDAGLRPGMTSGDAEDRVSPHRLPSTRASVRQATPLAWARERTNPAARRGDRMLRRQGRLRCGPARHGGSATIAGVEGRGASRGAVRDGSQASPWMRAGA
jgi:transposase